MSLWYCFSSSTNWRVPTTPSFILSISVPSPAKVCQRVCLQLWAELRINLVPSCFWSSSMEIRDQMKSPPQHFAQCSKWRHGKSGLVPHHHSMKGLLRPPGGGTVALTLGSKGFFRITKHMQLPGLAENRASLDACEQRKLMRWFIDKIMFVMFYKWLALKLLSLTDSTFGSLIKVKQLL